MIKWSRIIAFLLIIALTFGIAGFTTLDVAKGITLGLDLRGGFEILYQVKPIDKGQQITKQTLTDTVSALLKRVDIIGVAEPEINVEGSDRIRVRLAGVTNQEQARELLGKPAKLTFRDPQGKVLMTGNDLAENGAQLAYDELKRPMISLKLKEAEKFRKITEQYLQQPIGIYLDEKQLTNPVVQSVIPNGQAQITGNYSVDEAKELAAILNAGALPVEMKEIFSNSVGAKLGEKSLRNGIEAGVVAIIFIFAFMIFYYRWPGVIAVVTLVAYMYLVLLVLYWMQATLTLPGIAAFILGVGMAVDANIITYERIKEEIRSGKTLLSAVRAGSRRSFTTILDANVTTVIAAAVLFYYGSSSIQGFAVILILSITVSMLTAVLMTRLLMNLWVRSNALKNPWYYGVKESEIHEL